MKLAEVLLALHENGILYKTTYQHAACFPEFPLKLFVSLWLLPLTHAKTLHTRQTLGTLPTDSVDTAVTTTITYKIEDANN